MQNKPYTSYQDRNNQSIKYKQRDSEESLIRGFYTGSSQTCEQSSPHEGHEIYCISFNIYIYIAYTSALINQQEKLYQDDLAPVLNTLLQE